MYAEFLISTSRIRGIKFINVEKDKELQEILENAGKEFDSFLLTPPTSEEEYDNWKKEISEVSKKYGKLISDHIEFRKVNGLNKHYIYKSDAFTLPQNPQHMFYQIERIELGIKFCMVVSHDGNEWWCCGKPFTWQIGDRWKVWTF